MSCVNRMLYLQQFTIHTVRVSHAKDMVDGDSTKGKQSEREETNVAEGQSDERLGKER